MGSFAFIKSLNYFHNLKSEVWAVTLSFIRTCLHTSWVNIVFIRFLSQRPSLPDSSWCAQQPRKTQTKVFTQYWRLKTKDRQLQVLGFMIVNTAVSEAGLNVTTEGSVNKGQTCKLTIENLNSTVHFCAARLHSDTYHCSPLSPLNHHAWGTLVQQQLTAFYMCSFHYSHPLSRATEG